MFLFALSPFGLSDYSVHILKLFLICNKVVEKNAMIVKIRCIESMYARMSRVSFSFRSE